MRPALLALTLGVALAGCAENVTMSDAPPASGTATAREACLDAWAAEHGLNEYGDPANTLYTGGTPVFDEKTGRSTSRADYFFRRQPAARQRCAR